MTSTQGAVLVFAGVLVVVGGLKLAFWPWVLGRRAWICRALEHPES